MIIQAINWCKAPNRRFSSYSKVKTNKFKKRWL